MGHVGDVMPPAGRHGGPRECSQVQGEKHFLITIFIYFFLCFISIFLIDLFERQCDQKRETGRPVSPAGHSPGAGDRSGAGTEPGDQNSVRVPHE